MTHGTFRLGKVLGIPVSANWSALFGAVLIATSIGGLLPPAAGWAGGLSAFALGLAGALLFAASLLAHELGHALVARRAGIETAEITLWMFGGVAKITAEPSTPRDEARIAAAGPAVSLLSSALGVALALALGAVGAPAGIVTLAWLVGVSNATLGVFNLLPGFPLDGGRLLRAWYWQRHGDRDRGTLAATRGGRILGGALVMLGLFGMFTGTGGLWTVAMGVLLWTSARVEGLRVRWQMARREAEQAVRQTMAGAGVGPTGTPFAGWPGTGPVVDVRSWPASPSRYPSDLSMWPRTDPTSAGKTS